MARNIFNQPPPETPAAQTDAAAKPKPARLPGSVGGLRDSLREITANSIRDIDPDRIDLDGLRDRLALDDTDIDALTDSIRKHGQQVPIMVRPSEQPDRYRIVYGRRRLAAVRKLGGTIKAIVRTLDDDASVIAQGQENSLRLDPSFIEKAIFIKEMQDAGYKPAVIQDALGLTRQGVSNHRVVIEALPSELVRLIGPAHGIGRRQWGDLANLSTQVDLLGIAQKTIAALPPHISSPDRFQTVFSAASIAARAPKRNPARARSTPVKTAQGRTCGTLVSDERSLALKVSRKDNPAFCQWIEARAEDTLRQLFDQWERETGQTKP